MQLQVKLLAGDFGRNQAICGIRNLILGKMPFALGHGLGDGGFEFHQAISGCRADIINLLESTDFCQFGRQRQQLFLRRNIDLVEYQPLTFRPIFQAVQNLLDLWSGSCAAIDNQRNQIGITSPVPRGRNHSPVKPALRRKDTRRIDQYHLRFAFKRDAQHPCPRGLRFWTNDSDLLPDHRVDQSRFSRIRRADNGDMPASLGHARASRNASAAAVSAACLLFALALTGSKPLTVTVISKRMAWGGPSFLVIVYSGTFRPLAAHHS